MDEWRLTLIDWDDRPVVWKSGHPYGVRTTWRRYYAHEILFILNLIWLRVRCR